MKHSKAPTMRRGEGRKDSTRQGTGEDTISGETKVWDTSKLKKGRSKKREEEDEEAYLSFGEVLGRNQA
jgi:hypothetical protein